MEINNLSLLKGYLEAIERGATGQELASFFTEDVLQEEFPNRLLPQGARRDLEGILEAAVRGQKVMSGQRLRILNAIDNGDKAAVEIEWRGTLAVPMGTLPAGGEMRARFAIFVEFRDGKIARQHNYDCFDPW